MDASGIEAKEQVRQAVDIVDLVGGYLSLRRQGRNFVGLCPWHDDTKPSLQVNPDRQSFKCWVCDIGGDIFDFIMRTEGVEFREALELLAQRAGVQLSSGPAKPKAAPGSPDDKQTLYRAAAWAEEQFHRCLLDDPAAEPARRYLAARGINAESIAKFHLGFAPDRWDWLLTRAKGTSFSPAVLERAGLVIARDEGKGFYDRFRGRVLFSIRDGQSHEARPIALGGRVLPELAEGDPAKYINSPETPLFSKQRQVYGLDLARDAIQKKQNVVVVEGYTDCVMCHQHGVENVVAVLGTALGEKHVRLLQRFSPVVTLVLDGDAAGQRRTNEILELFVAAQVDLRILGLTGDIDPCDFVRTHGGEAFVRLLDGAVDALEYKIRTVTKGLDATIDTHRASTALEEVLGTVARAPRLSSSTTAAAHLREHQVLARLARSFHVPEEEIRHRLSELRRRGQRRPASVDDAPPAPQDLVLDSWDRELLEIIVSAPETLDDFAAAIASEDLNSPVARVIYAKCLALDAAGTPPTFDRLMLESENPAVRNLLVRLDEAARAKSSVDPQQRSADVINSFHRKKEDARHQQQLAALREESGDAESEAEAVGDLLASLRIRHRTSDPMEG